MSEIKKMLNRDEALELFDREAVFINGHDVVPASRAAELFGAEIVDNINVYESNRKDGEDRFLYSWGTVNLERVSFLTWRGFIIAVTYHNAGIEAAGNTRAKTYLKALAARRAAMAAGAGNPQALTAANIILAAAGCAPYKWEE